MENTMPQDYRNTGRPWNTPADFPREAQHRHEEERYAAPRNRFGQESGPRDRPYGRDNSRQDTDYYRRNDNHRFQQRFEGQRVGSRTEQSGPYYDAGLRRDVSQDEPHVYADEYNAAESEFRGDFNRLGEDARRYFGSGNYAGIDEAGPLTRYREGNFYGNAGERSYNAPERAPRYGYRAPGQSDWGHAEREFQQSAGRPTHADYYGGKFEAPEQSHRGRGPKGYERSDERLREIICERLTDDPYIDASDVSVDVANKKVTLTGFVNNRRTRYEVEELIERNTNVRDIDNQLRIRDQHAAPETDTYKTQEGRGPASGGSHVVAPGTAPPANKRN
jgi:osmotically-inducible protein OsmY